MWQPWRKTSSSQQQNCAWVFTLSSNITAKQNIRGSFRRRWKTSSQWALLTGLHKVLTWSLLNICGGNWRPSSIKDDRQIWRCLRILQKKNRLGLLGSGCYPTETTHSWLLASVTLIILTLLVLCFCKVRSNVSIQNKTRMFEHAVLNIPALFNEMFIERLMTYSEVIILASERVTLFHFYL